jgi:hypothetical protein
VPGGLDRAGVRELDHLDIEQFGVALNRLV